MSRSASGRADERPSGRGGSWFRSALLAAAIAVLELMGCNASSVRSDAGPDGDCTPASCDETCRASGMVFGSCTDGRCGCVAVPDAGSDEGAEGVSDGADVAPDASNDPWAIPLSARSEGEEWPFEPVFVRDLASLRTEPKPGCEQVTFAWSPVPESTGVNGAGYGWGLDIWDDRVAFVEIYFGDDGRQYVDRVGLVDTRDWKEYRIEQTALDGNEIWCDIAQMTEDGLVYVCSEDRGYSRTYVVWYSFSRHTKRLLPLDFSASGIWDAFGTTLISVRAEDPGDGYQVWTTDALTGESSNLSNFPAPAPTIWDAQIWGERVVWTMWGGRRIGSTTLTERSGDVYVPGPAWQWSPEIWEDRICWVDIRDGTGDVYRPTGAQVYCVEGADVSGAFRVSDAPLDGMVASVIAVHGDWVSWAQSLPVEERVVIQDGVLMAYHWPTGTRRRIVSDREPWPHVTPGAGFPQIWGDHLYFIAKDAAGATNCFRCDMRSFFGDVLVGP